jgi:hypothetical protein
VVFGAASLPAWSGARRRVRAGAVGPDPVKTAPAASPASALRADRNLVLLLAGRRVPAVGTAPRPHRGSGALRDRYRLALARQRAITPLPTVPVIARLGLGGRGSCRHGGHRPNNVRMPGRSCAPGPSMPAGRARLRRA